MDFNFSLSLHCMIMVMISSQEFSNCLFPLFATPDSNTISQEQWLSQMRTSTPRFFANITTITRAYKLNHSGDQQLGRPSGSQSGARGFARGDRLPHMQVITIMIEEDFVREAVKQGCISCGILVSGIRARAVSSEHMENMEMFSCSPT